MRVEHHWRRAVSLHRQTFHFSGQQKYFKVLTLHCHREQYLVFFTNAEAQFRKRDSEFLNTTHN